MSNHTFVNPEDIEVPEDRFRKEFPERLMQELRASILEVGLINPITVEAKVAGEKWILRAGERRLRVLKALISEGLEFRHGDVQVPRGTVPIVDWGALSPKQRVAIEVKENIDRSDFTYQERARALTAYHEFRKEENPEQTIKQTATEVNRKPAKGGQISEVSESLLIAKHLDDPDVAKAKDRKTALKVIRQKAELVHRARLALKFDPSKSPHQLIKGDAESVLPTLPANSFDVILTDPPYGVGADNFGDQSSTGHNYRDSPKYLEKILTWACDQTYRVAKEQAHCYLFCDVRRFERIATLMVLAGWKVFPTPLIWYKRGGMVPLPSLGPRRTYECILYAYKGEKPTLVLKNDCIVEIPKIDNLKHAAQKPVALYKELLSRSAVPGDSVLDFMGGSGTILVAANIMKLRATYIEEDQDSYNIALQRMNTQEIDDGAKADDGLNIQL